MKSDFKTAPIDLADWQGINIPSRKRRFPASSPCNIFPLKVVKNNRFSFVGFYDIFM